MKKTLLITAITALASIGAFAQGYVNALNGSGTPAVYLQVSSASDGSNPVKVGSPANAAGFVGVGPGQVVVQIYEAVNGTSLVNLETSTPIATVTNSSNASLASAQGTFPGGNPLNFAYTSGTVEFIAYAYTLSGGYTGWSSEATGITPGTSGSPAPALFGTAPGQINSFIITPVPEPTTMALGGIGAAALLLFRRKK